jgi:hypothetical protein
MQEFDAIAYGNYVYTAGGLDNNGTGLKSKTYRYDPTNGSWNDAAIPDLPQERAAALSGWLNGRWVIASGDTYAGYTTSVIAWNPATNTWSSLPNTLQGFSFAGGGGVGQLFFMVGGQNPNSQRNATAQRYTEVPCVPFTPTPTTVPTTCPIQFSDVPQGSTFYANIRCLACRGIINGYPDGTFKPNANVTRGQLSKIVSNSAGFNDTQSTQMYQDVAVGSTFFQFIGRLASRGFINGYACGGAGEPCVPPGNLPYFRPNANATRGQTSKIVGNTFFPNCQTPSGVKR